MLEELLEKIRTSWPGRPCIWALILHGSEGLPHWSKMMLLQSVEMSSESIRSPSMSKRQARIAGKLHVVDQRTECRRKGAQVEHITYFILGVLGIPWFVEPIFARDPDLCR